MIIWREIDSMDGYEVSNEGQVRSLNYGKRPGVVQELRIQTSPTGTRIAKLPGGRISVAYLVLSAFGSKRPSPKHIPFHINGNSSDDRIENLQWLHRSDMNSLLTRRAIANGTYKKPVRKNLFVKGHKINQKKPIE